MTVAYPFTSNAYELRALLFSKTLDLMSPDPWKDACLFSGRLSSWTFANSTLVSMQHRNERTLHPDLPALPTLIASGAAWVRAGRFARSGCNAYRIIKVDEMGGLSTGMVYDISQTDGTPFLNLAPSHPSSSAIITSMESMFGEFTSDGVPLHVSRGESLDRDCRIDGRTVWLDGSLDESGTIHALSKTLAFIILSGEETAVPLDFITESASLMVCAAFSCDVGGLDSPDPSTLPVSTLLLEAGGLARRAARRIIAFCGRNSGFRDGSLLSPGPTSTGNGPLVGEDPSTDMDQEQSTSIIVDNPVPAVDSTSFDLGGVL